MAKQQYCVLCWLSVANWFCTVSKHLAVRCIKADQNDNLRGLSGQYFLRANDMRIPKLMYDITAGRRDVGRPKKRG
jgi:hypothetical protein